MIKYLIFFTFLFFLSNSFGEESFLTLKQQLDRLQREVNDLSKSVYSHNATSTTNKSNQTDNLAAIDIRIYDLEKDIKNLTPNFEELTFAIDELKKLFDEINIDMETRFSEIVTKQSLLQNSDLTDERSDDLKKQENSSKKNTLGELMVL